MNKIETQFFIGQSVVAAFKDGTVKPGVVVGFGKRRVAVEPRTSIKCEGGDRPYQYVKPDFVLELNVKGK